MNLHLRNPNEMFLATIGHCKYNHLISCIYINKKILFLKEDLFSLKYPFVVLAIFFLCLVFGYICSKTYLNELSKTEKSIHLTGYGGTSLHNLLLKRTLS